MELRRLFDAGAFRRLALVLASLCLFAGAWGHAAQGQEQQIPLSFRDKVVLLLPVLNTTGEKWEELKLRINAETAKTFGEEFAKLGMSLSPDATAQKCVQASSVDLSDEESWRRDVFYDLGKAAEAEFVVFCVVTQASQRTRVNLFSSVPEGDVTLKVWILDAKNRAPLLSAKSVNAKARSKANLFGEAKGSDCQVEAARRAVREAIKQAFEPKKT